MVFMLCHHRHVCGHEQKVAYVLPLLHLSINMATAPLYFGLGVVAGLIKRNLQQL